MGRVVDGNLSKHLAINVLKIPSSDYLPSLVRIFGNSTSFTASYHHGLLCSKMSTQYETIQASYDEIRKSSIALIERVNVQETLAPFIKNARVLDLACGSGFYSYHFPRWGASKVVGVDISPAMIEEARTVSSRVQSSGATIDYQLADCSKPLSYEGGPFDIVFGAWLLNYAPSGKDMVEMFRNVALNLRDGGRFVAVTTPPTQDPAAFVEAERKARPSESGGSGGLFCSVTKVLEDGIAVHVHADTRHGNVDFDCYHLRKEIYEASAREGGLRGKLTWSVTAVPDEFLKDRRDGASVEELESYKVTPHYGLLVLAK